MVALSATVPHVAGVVGLETMTLSDAPPARLFGLSERTPFVMLHGPTFDEERIVQFRPAFLGRRSNTLTPESVPGPVFLTEIW